MLPIDNGRKLFAGSRVRRVRSARGLTQTRMASDLGVSVSYLNLIERDQRPLSAAFLLKLAGTYDLDLKSLTGDDGAGLAEELAAVFTDPRLTGIDVPRGELRELAARSPGIAQALLRLHADAPVAPAVPARQGPLDTVIRMIAEAGNHFAGIDHAAEALSDELRLSGPDLNNAVVERLRARHAITVRVMPVEVLPGLLRRLDLHARQLQVSEALDAASRGFAAAVQLALIELKLPIDDAISAAGVTDPLARHACTVALAKYAAGAMLMPYARFLAACEATGYDVELLQARFGRGLEQIVHRLVTLGRPGARGIPFFFLRIDRAGLISKSFAHGASPIPKTGGCALWNLYAAFDRPGEVRRQLGRDGGRAALPDAGPHRARHRCPMGSRTRAVRHRPRLRRRPCLGAGVERRPRPWRPRHPHRPRLCRLPPCRLPPAQPAAIGRASGVRRAPARPHPFPFRRRLKDQP